MEVCVRGLWFLLDRIEENGTEQRGDLPRGMYLSLRP